MYDRSQLATGEIIRLLLKYYFMTCSRYHWVLLLASLALITSTACVEESDGTHGRMAMALGGQFFPGELTSLDLFIYDAEECECDPESGSLSTEPSTAIESLTDISLVEPQAISFELPRDEYVIYGRAGQSDGSRLDVIARGCATVSLAAQAEVSLFLHRLPSCGDGDLDLQEMCDDENTDDGDGCDSSCATEAEWVNDEGNFVNGQQSLPLAAGDSDFILLSWRSDYVHTQQAPHAFFDTLGRNSGLDRLNFDWNVRNSTSVAVHGDTAILTYLQGDGSPSQQDSYIIGWVSGTQLPALEFGLEADTDVVTALLSDSEAIVVSETPIGLAMRVATINDEAIVVAETSTPVDDSSESQEAPAIAAGDGDFVIAWQDGDDVNARFFNSPESATATVNLCQGVDRCSAPAVAGLGGASGRQYLVVYLDSGARVVGRYINMLGEASSQFEISTEGGCRELAVAPLNASESEFIVTWTQRDDPEEGAYPAQVYARVVNGVEEFGYLAAGNEIVSEPFRVTDANGGDHDQSTVVTSFGMTDSSTALVFFRALDGVDDTDIGFRLLRVTRVPSGS